MQSSSTSGSARTGGIFSYGARKICQKAVLHTHGDLSGGLTERRVISVIHLLALLEVVRLCQKTKCVPLLN